MQVEKIYFGISSIHSSQIPSLESSFKESDYLCLAVVKKGFKRFILFWSSQSNRDVENNLIAVKNVENYTKFIFGKNIFLTFSKKELKSFGVNVSCKTEKEIKESFVSFCQKKKKDFDICVQDILKKEMETLDKGYFENFNNF